MDFEIKGVVGIRLIDPTDADVQVITRQLGESPATLNKEPDIIIRFRKDWTIPILKYLGLNSAAFTNDGFFLLGQKTGKVEARIPFEAIGERCEIECQSGLNWIPLLFEIIMLTFLKKNYVALHASAFHFQGSSILVMGWAKGGKTESLLAFANHGADYIGDELVLLSPKGDTMFGLPIPLAIWDWQFRHIPKLMPKLSLARATLFKLIHLLDRIHSLMSNNRFKRSVPVVLLGNALPALRRRLKIWASPQQLFGDHVNNSKAAPKKLFLVMGHSDPEIVIEDCDPMEIAQRMMHSNEYERRYIFEYYKAFKFAFPHLKNEFLEQVDELQRSLIRQALAGKQAYKVLHPYPVSFDALFSSMRPYCEAKT